MGSRQEALIQRFPNGTTQLVEILIILYLYKKRTKGSETSQYLEEEKSIEILLVAASENGLERLYLAIELVEVVGMLRHRE